MSPTLQLQSVVYNNDSDDIERLIASIKQSVVLAKKAGLVSDCKYVIGDCSPNEFVKDAKKWVASFSDDDLDVEYEFFNENLGHGGGQNRMALNSEYEIIGLVNPDVIVSPHLVEHLLTALQDEEVGIAEAAQIPMEHPKDYNRITMETTFSSGCCFFIKQKTFASVNGFDQKNFFMYCDDVDLSWRIRLEGKKIVFCPRAFVYHDHRIDESNTLIVGHAEFYYSALGGLMLALKWGDNDRAQRIIENLENDPAYKDVYNEYLQLLNDDLLPSKVEGAEKVGVFTPTGFAKYRWIT